MEESLFGSCINQELFLTYSEHIPEIASKLI